MAFAADPDTEAPTLASSFNIETYTGNASTNSITGLGFSPNLIWLKERSGTDRHVLIDTIRGANSQLSSNDNNAETTYSSNLDSFETDGFTLGSASETNGNGETYVGWTWKADDNEPTIFGGPAIAVYKFEDNANDVTGNNNGTASNVSYVTGNFNKAAEFNGSNSGVNIGNLGIGGAAARTISAWVYVDSLSSAQTIFQYGANSNGQRFGFAIDTAGKIYVEYYNRDAITSASHISTNTWYHLAVTYNGGAVQTAANTQIYVDGVAVSMSVTGGQTGNANTGDSNYGIGYDRLNTRQYFDGKIDQVRIYKGDLGEYQISELYAETVTNNDDITFGGLPVTLISANANAGFSIVKSTTPSSPAPSDLVAHGLSSAPDMIIYKPTTVADDWYVYHSAMGLNKFMSLQSPAAQATATDLFGTVNATGFSTKNTNTGNRPFIAYCFHDVSGYQKFGGYTGDGSTGQTITTGFKSDFVMIKSTFGTSNWTIYDTRRGVTSGGFLNPDNSDAETSDSLSPNITITATGFSITSGGVTQGLNSNTRLYIYWAIKMNPTQYPISAGQMAFLVVAGGGSGYYSQGAGGVGGGGAGGLRTSYGLVSGGGNNVESNITLATGTYTITVGAGGASSSGSANNGGDSSISATGLTTISSTGGGGGAGGNAAGAAGGSGSGAGENYGTALAGGAGTANQGFAGGTSVLSSGGNAAGGGGAGAVGGNNSITVAGNGGLGITSAITGSNVGYAGGGGGSAYQTSSTGGLGTYGGGSGTLNGIRTVATAGETNTGGGGGALGGSISASGSTAGGSGVVVLRLLTSQYSGTTTGSPTITTEGSETILKYTASGTYVHS